MRSASFLMVAALFLSNALMAQGGRVDCSLSVPSEILGRDMPYSVYLPPGYETSERPYPVLYLLHGMFGDYTDWVVKGEVHGIADRAIASGEAPEMIIVMPDGLDFAFYINNYDGSIRWEDFFYEEFVPHVEKTFRIVGDRPNRAIAGLSMGGYGALYHALAHRDMYDFCYAMSAAVLEMDPVQGADALKGSDRAFMLKTLGPLNEEGFPENYKKYSVQEMVKAMDTYQAPRPRFGRRAALPDIHIDCGDEDFLLEFNTNLVHLMRKKELPLEFRVHDGGHDWSYWRSALALALAEVGRSFRDY